MFFKKKDLYRFIKYRLLKYSPLHSFLRWKQANANGQFYEYYVEQETKSLEKGLPHPSLGGNLKAGAFRQSGLEVFNALVEKGLQPSHVCVDYGCGSLRVGQHLMEYLRPGHYYGLDITDHFFNLGKTLLPPDLLQQKSPNLHLIDDSILNEISLLEPDFIFSAGVLIHIPPFEMDNFLTKIIALIGPKTQALIRMAAYEENIQFSPLSWAYSKEYIQQRLLALDENLEVSFIDFYDFTKDTAVGELTIQRGTALIKKINNI